MLRKNIVLILLFAGLLMTSCDRLIPIPAGYLDTRNFNVGTFNAIEAHNAIDVVYCDVDQIVVTTDANALDKIIVKLDGQTLVLRYPPRWRSLGETRVLVPRQNFLHDVELSGASSFISDSCLVADEFDLELSGASTFSAPLSARKLDMDLSGASTVNSALSVSDELDVHASGASNLNLFGQAPRLDVELSGASSISTTKSNGSYNFASNHVEGGISGASMMRFHCDGSIRCSLSGGSEIFYTGTATTMGSNCSGGSNINHE